MIIILDTNIDWTEDVREAMESVAFRADWPDIIQRVPPLEWTLDANYTMDDLVADMNELIDLGAFGEIILANNCSDYPLIKVSISHGVISSVAVHNHDISAAFKSARSIDLYEI